ncbi:MAG: diguanylate cyclase [Wenzhouxiangella sp.]|jgi:diguanylate cyclase (GGDEF)-like protein|nr:diguanylate cyclase [Wenzhouxiangella sp.]
MKKRHLIFLALSLILLLIDTIFVVANQRALDEETRRLIRSESEQLHNAFSTVLDQTYSNLLTIATFVANDSQASQLFLEGARAVEEEGGGAGGPRAARARNALYELLADNWLEVQRNFSTRQLHYHLGPGSTSFLRVHRPERFGDNMDQVRFTVVDTNAEKTSRSGFETGRVYSGLRGVVPVYAFDQNVLEDVYVGALEAGTSFDRVLDVLSANYDSHSAVLLTEEHVRAKMWPDAIEQVFAKRPTTCQCVVEATTDDQIEQLADVMVDAGFFRPGYHADILDIDGVPTLVSTDQIRDYRGTLSPELPAVGRVVFWRDATDMVGNIHAAKRFNLLFAASAFVLVEILLYFGLKIALRKLEQEVELRVTEVRRSEHRLQRAQDIAGLGIWDWASSGNKVVVSEHGRHMLSIDDKTGQTTLEAILERVHPEDRERVESAMRSAAATGERIQLDHRIVSESGQEFVVQHFAEPETGSDGEVRLCSTLLDVTDRHRQAEQLREAATHDHLTGILNRAGFRTLSDRILSKCIRDRAEVALMMLDADHFKRINDTYGHEVGDQVLVALTRMISENLRPYDVFGRIGGEEFAILFPDTPAFEAQQIAERLLALIRAHRLKIDESTNVRFTVSAGVAAGRAPDVSLDQLLSAADRALYGAKAGGRDRIELDAPVSS